MKNLLLGFLFLVFSANTAFSSEIEDITAHLKAGDFSVVQSRLVPLAESGDARAQFNLGVAYLHGNGVPQSDEKSFYWTEKAAQQGFARAEMNLASNYQFGKGTKQDFAKALEWYEAARKDPEVAANAAGREAELNMAMAKSTSRLAASISPASGNN